jgi:hypothetical protein
LKVISIFRLCLTDDDVDIDDDDMGAANELVDDDSTFFSLDRMIFCCAMVPEPAAAPSKKSLRPKNLASSHSYNVMSSVSGPKSTKVLGQTREIIF